MHSDNAYINSYRFIDALSDHLQPDSIVVTDMGTALLSGHQNIKIKDGMQMFTSLGLGEMGYGLPGSLGAGVANPGKPIVCLNCDGGIMMNLQELQTIKDSGIPLKLVIFNNDGYLMIKHTQKMLFNGNYVSVNNNTGIGIPEFDKLMPAFGFSYFRLEDPEKCDMMISDFLNQDGLSVLEVFMDPEQDFIPKVKGVLQNDNTILPPPIEEMSPLLSLDDVTDNMLISISETTKILNR
jgi:acetolactate synthase-1/2/3 large subunit